MKIYLWNFYLPKLHVDVQVIWGVTEPLLEPREFSLNRNKRDSNNSEKRPVESSVSLCCVFCFQISLSAFSICCNSSVMMIFAPLFWNLYNIKQLLAELFLSQVGHSAQIGRGSTITTCPQSRKSFLKFHGNLISKIGHHL